MKVLGIAGSLRRASYNKALLQAAIEVAPDGMELEVFDLEGIPLYNQDLEKQPPVRVTDFKTRIRTADAILISTPEYNYSIPGVLKNAIDWASRPYGDNAFDDKPVALMGASVGMIATARAQYHLRQSFVFLNMHPVNRPEVMVPFADRTIDNMGRLTDETARQKIRELLESLMVWTRKISAKRT
jgi:chromate reductase, NAD(P)H dehydrogenase (quinone)